MPKPIYDMEPDTLACPPCKNSIDKILDILDDDQLDIFDFEYDVSNEPGVSIDPQPGVERIRRVTFDCGGYFEYVTHGDVFVVVVDLWRCPNPIRVP